MERTRFWSRVGQWFQGVNGVSDGDGGRSAADRDANVAERSGDDEAPSDPSKHGAASRWNLLGRTSAQAAGLGQLNEQLREMSEAWRAFRAEEAERFAAARQVIDDIRKTLNEIAAGVDAQRGLTERVAGRTDDQTACARRSEQSLAQLPKIAEAQQALMASLTQHLELSRQTTEKATGAIDQLHTTLAAIGESIQSSAEAVEEVRRVSSQGTEEVAELIRGEARRMMWFAIAVIALLALGIVAGWIAVFR